MIFEELSNPLSDTGEGVSNEGMRKLKKFAGADLSSKLLGTLKEALKDMEKVDRILKIAYRENLKWVLGNIADLVTTIDGAVVITADHGELLGEYGLHFHTDLPLPQLRLVPWFTIK